MDAHINNSDIPIHPGQKVKYHIDKLSISQKTLAKLISLSPSTLSEVLSGKRPVTTEYAMLFEAALGMNLDELLSMQTEYNKYIAGTDTRFRAKVTRIRTLTPFVTEEER